MSAFNPYREWLGLSIDSDLPDHYQLLGVMPEDCTDRDFVLEAAQRQLAKLKVFDVPQNRDALKALVTEIKAAVRCINNPSAREDYDNELRKKADQRAVNTHVPGQPDIPIAVPANPSNVDVPRSPGISESTEIPFAIPLSNVPSGIPETISESPSEANRPAFGDADAIRGLVIRKKKKKQGSGVLWLGHLMILVSVPIVILLLRPDLRQRALNLINGKSGTEQADEPVPSNQPTAIATGGDTTTSKTSTQVTPPTNPKVEPKPEPDKIEPSTNPESANTEPVTTTTSPPVEPAVTMPAVAAAKAVAIPDPVADFYARSIIGLLAMQDTDGAVELYSRLDPDGLSDQRKAMYQRLGTVANLYSQFRGWLRDAAGKIPGGTSLEVGVDKLQIAIVEASTELVIIRDRGENIRFPFSLVPNGVAWAMIEQMRPGEPFARLSQEISRGIRNWDQSEPIEKVVAGIGLFESADATAQQAKDAALGWFQVDRPLLLEKPGPLDFRDAHFAEAMAGLESAYKNTPQTIDSVHEWILSAFLESDPWLKVARLTYARQMAIDISDVGLAMSLHIEWVRFFTSESISEQHLKFFQYLSTKTVDQDGASRLLNYLLRLLNESGDPLTAAQRKSILKLASEIATQHKLVTYADAVQRASAAK